MSFLNPISEPVLMYSSTDANAPQINLAARTAGDVKTVLKACLVTGYGTKQGAGWTIKSETATGAMFVSPSVTMIDYKIGIDDRSASQTVWYYTYKNTRANPSDNTIIKDKTNISEDSTENGWRLLVTNRGVIFIELYYQTEVNAVMCRMTYIGRVKSTLASEGKNILFWCTGVSAPNFHPTNEIRQVKHCFVNNYTDLYFTAANMAFIEPTLPRNISTVEVINSIFLHNGSNVIAEVPGILLNAVNDDLKLFGCYVTTFESRSMLYVCLGLNYNLDQAKIYSIGILIYLDKWEY